MPKTVIVITAALLLGGCHGAIWGNLVALGITVGIFVGTLSLGRSDPSRGSPGSISAPDKQARHFRWR